MNQPLPPNNLRIYDLPATQGQVHIHGDAACGRVYDYSRKNFQPLNAYESAMADLSAQQLNMSPIDRTLPR